MLNPSGDLAKVCKEIVNEKNRAERDLEDSRNALRQLLNKKDQIRSDFQHKTLKDFLEKAMVAFDKKSGEDKKALIQAIVPEIIIHENNQVELRLNPDPKGNVLPET